MADSFERFIDELKTKINIVDLIRQDGHPVGRVIPRGATKISSPLRKERTPSFAIYADQNSWYDFGTHKGGDIINYVCERDGCDTAEAIEKLARSISIDMPWANGGGSGGVDYSGNTGDEIKLKIFRAAERRTVLSLMSHAAEWYHNEADFPSDVLEVLHSNYGMTDATISKFRVGWGYPGLFEFFREEMLFSEEACLSTGLFRFNKWKKSYSGIFEGRIIFPYWSTGQVSYFVARRFDFKSSHRYQSEQNEHDAEKAKYRKAKLHEKDERISEWIRNDRLFNEDALRKPAEFDDWIVITEGVSDCIAFDQAGFICVSPVTTVISESDWPRLLELLDKHARGRKIVICNDSDVTRDGKHPGELGALKTAAMLHSKGYEVAVAAIPMPAGTTKIDSCDYIREHGAHAMREVIHSAQSHILYMADKIPPDLGPAEFEAELRPIYEAIAASPSELQRDLYTDLVEKRVGIKKKASRQLLSAAKPVAKALAKSAERAVQASVEAKQALDNPKTPESLPDDWDGPLVPPAPPTLPGGGGGGGSQSSRPPSSNRSVPGDLGVRGEVFVPKPPDHTAYYTANSKTGNVEKISEFVMIPKQILVVDGGEIMDVDVQMTNGTKCEMRVEPGSWTSRRRFVEGFPDGYMVFNGTDENVGALRHMLSKSGVPKRKAVREIGYVDTPNGPRWVWADGTIDKDGFQKEPDVLCVAGDSSLSEMISYEDAGEAAMSKAGKMAQRAFPLIFKMNDPRVVLGTLGWLFATAFKPRIMEIMKCFPILMVYGTPGSGKSTLFRDILMPMFGLRPKNGLMTCTSTEFATKVSLGRSTSIPIVLDEYKRAELDKVRLDQLSKYVRHTYGGQIIEKGNKDQTVTIQKLTAPLAIIGESQFGEEASVFERILFVPIEKSFVSSNPSAGEAYLALRKMSLHVMAPAFIQWSLSQEITESFVEEMMATAAAAIAGTGVRAPERVLANVAVFLIGVTMFDRWCTHLGVSNEVLKNQLVSTITMFLTEVGVASPVNGELANTRDAFDSFMESLARLSNESKLLEGTHYAVFLRDGNRRLCFHLASCHEIYSKEQVMLRQSDQTNGVRALKQLAKEKSEMAGSYITHVDRRANLEFTRAASDIIMAKLDGYDDHKRYLRCVEIDEDKIPHHMDYIKFRVTSVRGHGGARSSDHN